MRLDTLLDIETMSTLQQYTAERFKDNSGFRFPEAYVLSEQQILPNKKIKELLEEEYGTTLFEPIKSYMPNDVIDAFRGSGVIPIVYQSMLKKIQCVYLPEHSEIVSTIQIPFFTVEYLPTTIYYYIEAYDEKYGKHPSLLPLPAKTYFEIISKEAIMLEAADITISTLMDEARTYYNIRKKKVLSKRTMPESSMQELITFLCSNNGFDQATRNPKYVSTDINKDFRGRVLINRKFKGWVITIRLLPNAVFNRTLESLNLRPGCLDFCRTVFEDKRPGLRIVAGPTMSGKNFTCLSILKEILSRELIKVVEVDMFVEQYLPEVEQISCEDVDEYVKNIESLIHQNPDFVYIAEIRDEIAKSVMNVTQTGKRVLSTLHANSAGEVLFRLQDITGLSIDRILLTLHSVVYQTLERNDEEDKVYPDTHYVEFTEELKQRLYGKSTGEIIEIIKECERSD